MKKNQMLFSMLAMAGMLGVTSCSQDEILGEGSGNLVDATFTVATSDAIGTRAIGDGTTVDKVVCAVFDEKGEEMTALRQTKNIEGKKATYNIRLAKGQQYRVAFFAYNEAADAYDVTDMKNIEVKPDQKSNVEGRDAFTAYVDVEPTTNDITKNITLKRPFAQLNLGVDATELEAAKNAGVNVTKSRIVVSNVYNAFSAYNNAVVATATEGEMTFELNKIPTEMLEIDINGNETIEDNEKFTYLALNYLLVGNSGTEKSLTDVEFVWETADGKTNDPASTFMNIPVQRNYRTNILGKLLTNPADFNIVIDADFDGDKNVQEGGENGVTTVTTTVATVAELTAAIENAVVGNNIIKFEQDIDANSTRAAASLTIPQTEKVNFVIDGCGFKFDGKFYLDGNSRSAGEETLTFKNINFTHTTDDSFIFIDGDNADASVRYGHNVIVDGCSFTGSGKSGNVVGMKYRQCFNMVVKNTTATDMHSLMQLYGTAGVTLESVTVENSGRGISAGTSTNVVLNNCNFTVDTYGVRADGVTTEMKVKNATITANLPIVVRKLTTGNAYKISLEGENTLTAGQAYEVIFTNGDDGEFVPPTGTYSITGAESFNVYPEDAAADQPKIASTAAKLKEYLADPSIAKILLGEGAVIEGTFDVKRAVAIKSVSADNKATIKGRVNVSSADATFNNIKFAINDASKDKNTFSGAPYQYPGIVVAYGAAMSFEGCEFEASLSAGVCGINAGNHADSSDFLTVNNCTFKGDFYAIRARTLFSITNSEFDIYTDQGTLAAVWTWGNANSGANSVTFTNNTNMNANKIYSVQMTASNFKYDNIKINIQKNTDFLHVSEGVNPAMFDGTHTFAEGSETF